MQNTPTRQPGNTYFHQLLESLPQLIWTCRADGPCDYLSRQWLDYTGLPEAPQLGYGWLEQLHPDDRQPTLARWLAVAPKGDAFDVEFRIRRHDGVYRWFRTRAVPLRDEQGRVVEWVGSNTDIEDLKQAALERAQNGERLRSEVAARTADIERLNRDLAQRLVESQQMEKRLRLSEARFHGAFESAGIGMALVGLNGRWLSVNPALCRIIGYSADELMAMTFQDITHPDDLETDLSLVRQLLAGDIPSYQMDKRYFHKDGHTVWIRLSVSLVRDEMGEPEHFVSQIEDISARQQAEEKAQTMLRSSIDGFWRCDLQGRFLEVNDAYCAMIGYSREELLGMAIPDIEAVEQPEDTARHIENIRATGSDRFETRHRHKDGRLLDMEISVVHLPEWQWLYVFSRDITEQKRAAERIARQKHLEEAINTVFETALTAPSDEAVGEVCLAMAEQLTGSGFGFIGEMNPAGLFDTIAISNPGWDACKVPLGEARLVIKNMAIRGVDRATLREGKSRIVNGPEAFTAHPDHVPTPAGHPELTAFMGVPLKELGKTFGMIAVGNKEGGYTDDDLQALEALAIPFVVALTHKRDEVLIGRLNEDLKRQTAWLATANKDLESFAYSVSHDLRAPLRAIDGFIAMLLKNHTQGLDAEGLRMFGVVRDNARKMGELIDDILHLSRAGRLELRLAEVDMTALAEQVWEDLAATRGQHRVRFELKPLPAAYGDRAALTQVLTNLFDNAIKFSAGRDPAVIEMGGHEEGNEAIYYVKDNGAGFDMTYASKLFGVFERLHGQDEFAGTGIGLAIVKRLISRHDGRVWGEGRVNEGATFHFALPRREPCEGEQDE